MFGKKNSIFFDRNPTVLLKSSEFMNLPEVSLWTASWVLRGGLLVQFGFRLLDQGTDFRLAFLFEFTERLSVFCLRFVPTAFP